MHERTAPNIAREQRIAKMKAYETRCTAMSDAYQMIIGQLRLMEPESDAEHKAMQDTMAMLHKASSKALQAADDSRLEQAFVFQAIAQANNPRPMPAPVQTMYEGEA